MHWCFAKVNNRLAEAHFEKGKKLKILGHCYVQVREYTTKKEKDWIKIGTKRLQLVYRKGKCRRLQKTPA